MRKVPPPPPPSLLYILRHLHHLHHHRIANIRKITHAEQFYPELEKDATWVNKRDGSPIGSRAEAQRRVASQPVSQWYTARAVELTSSRPSPDERVVLSSRRREAAQRSDLACLAALRAMSSGTLSALHQTVRRLNYSSYFTWLTSSLT